MAEKTKLRFLRSEIVETKNWLNGEPIDPKIPKKLCMVTFKDETGQKYFWFPLEQKSEGKGELNQICRHFVHADAENVKNLRNAEPRYDIRNLIKILKRSPWNSRKFFHNYQNRKQNNGNQMQKVRTGGL